MLTERALWVFLLLAVPWAVESAHIVVISAITSKSEMVVFYPYAEALAEKGHDVTIITPYPPKKPLRSGVTSIHPKVLVESAFMDDTGRDLVYMKHNNMMSDKAMREMFEESVIMITDMVINQDQEIKQLVNSGKKVDLLVINGVLNDFALPLVHLFKCPFIYLETPGVYSWHLSTIGAPLTTAYEPGVDTKFGDRMNFMERVFNTYSVLSWQNMRENSVIPKLEKMLTPEYIKKDTPPLLEIDRNVSIILAIRDISLDYPRSLPPQVKTIGCLHCQAAKPLPKDIAEFVEGSGKHGFIYLSFGTVVPMDVQKDLIRRTFFKAIAQLPQRFLVKWETEVTNEEIGAPPNVLIRQWYPQQDVLGHPKIKAFISHGGLFSTMETVYHGVPVLSFPFLFDQDFNAALAQKHGFGIMADIVTITSDQILDALRRLTTDPSFQKNAKHRANLLRDHPIPPMENAVYWTEFVLRHDGAAHLRPVSRELPFYKSHLLDIMLAAVVAALVVLVISFLMLKCLLRVLCSLFSGSKSKKD